ncbi:MAG: hypothetical protein WAN36_09575 [Calditrichia bacterium]
MKKTRVLMTLLLSFFLTITLSCEKETTEELPAPVQDELSMLPQNPMGVGYLDVNAIRNSPFYQNIAKENQSQWFTGRDYQEFVNSTGIDLQKDINQLYFSMNTPSQQTKPQFLILAGGNFNENKIMDFVSKENADSAIQESSYGKYHLYYTEKGKMALAFPENSRVVLGNEQMVKDFLNNLEKGPQNSDIAESIRNQISGLKYKSEMWFTIDARDFISDFLEKNSNSPQAQKFSALKSLDHLNFSMKADEDVYLNGSGIFDDQENASLFFDMAKGMIATAKLAMSGDRRAVDTLNKIKMELNGSTIEMNMQMSWEDWQHLQNQQKQMGQFQL